jgi:DNA-binding beta-propeller fold protein YncE
MWCLLLAGFSQTTGARSVYVITKHGSSVAAAYDINDGAIDYQTTAQGLPDHGFGAVGLALDPDSETLFVTYEKASVALDKIELVDAKIMQVEQGPATAPGAENLAGIVFDSANQKLYAVDRGTTNLFVYLWDSVAKTLTPDGENPRTLSELGSPSPGAYGLALNQPNSWLYVTDSTSTVRYYDTNDPNFAYRGSIEIEVSGNSRKAVGIAIDSTRRYMYTGAFTGSSGQHTYVVRTDINDINNPTFSENPIGTYAIGLTVDEATGFLYVTTDNDHIEVYNTNTWPSDPCDTETSDISGPADIIVAGDVAPKGAQCQRLLRGRRPHNLHHYL